MFQTKEEKIMAENSLTLASAQGLVPMAVLSVGDAIQRRKDFLDFVNGCMVEGKDYGVIEGTDKQTLLKPGAEKALSLYGLTSRMEILEEVKDWERGFFSFRHKCVVIWPRRMEDGSIREEVIFEGIGSCNSMEKKYAGRWLPYDKLSDSQKKDAAAGRLKSETRSEWIVEFAIKELDDETVKAFQGMMHEPPEKRWPSKPFVAKSGKQFTKWLVPGVTMYLTPNEGIYDQVNTIEKMSQKRALVCAALGATNASDLFTQDMEDQLRPVPGDKTSKKDEPVIEDAVVVEPEKPKVNPRPSRRATAPPAETAQTVEATKAPTPEKPKAEDSKPMTEIDAERVKAQMDAATETKVLNYIVHKLEPSWRTTEIMEHYAKCLKAMGRKVATA